MCLKVNWKNWVKPVPERTVENAEMKLTSCSLLFVLKRFKIQCVASGR